MNKLTELIKNKKSLLGGEVEPRSPNCHVSSMTRTGGVYLSGRIASAVYGLINKVLLGGSRTPLSRRHVSSTTGGPTYPIDY